MTEDKIVKKRERLDQTLVNMGIARDLKEAGSIIMAGKVIVDDHRVDKPGTVVSTKSEVRVRQLNKYASRGGEKLEGAIKDFNATLLFKDKNVIDVGSSTGGFTDYCLQAGAKCVIAVEVGTNQLAWELKNDPRVVVREKTDIRDFVLGDAPAPDIVVADVSFIALETLAEPIVKAAGPYAVDFFLMVKPQFELDVSEVPKGGVVTDDTARIKARDGVTAAFKKLGLEFVDAADSRVSGATGNKELFVWLKKKPV
jgi:23S rRNA (cytidine1920-2'-O)/16S rRNA (cytidine1409-2'-O)-methyltransferase